MIFKALVVLFALVSVVAASPSDGYAIQKNYAKGSGCSAATHFETRYYAINQCSYYNLITYVSATFIQIQGTGTVDCQSPPAGYNQQLDICVSGSNTDYIWSFVPALNNTLLQSGLPTYTLYSASSANVKCTVLPTYIRQSYSACQQSAGTTYQSFTQTCSGNSQTTIRYSDAACTTGATTVMDTLINTCQLDSNSYYYANSCGASINSLPTTTTTTTTTTKGPVPTNADGSPVTTATPTNANGTPVTTATPTNADGTPINSNNAALLSISSFLVVASLAAFLL